LIPGANSNNENLPNGVTHEEALKRTPPHIGCSRPIVFSELKPHQFLQTGIRNTMMNQTCCANKGPAAANTIGSLSELTIEHHILEI
jgi:hypothetical protein